MLIRIDDLAGPEIRALLECVFQPIVDSVSG
jgi:hypothetical protein